MCAGPHAGVRSSTITISSGRAIVEQRQAADRGDCQPAETRHGPFLNASEIEERWGSLQSLWLRLVLRSLEHCVLYSYAKLRVRSEIPGARASRRVSSMTEAA